MSWRIRYGASELAKQLRDAAGRCWEGVAPSLLLDAADAITELRGGDRCREDPECLLDNGHLGQCDVQPYEEDYGRCDDRPEE